jgi:hypothetical protein
MRLLHSMLDFFVATLLNPLYLYLHAFNIQMNINCGIRGLHRGLCGTSGAGGNMLLRSTWIRFYRLAPQRTHFQGRHFFGSAWNRMEAVRTCRDSTEARRLHKIAQNLKYVSLMIGSTGFTTRLESQPYGRPPWKPVPLTLRAHSMRMD